MCVEFTGKWRRAERTIIAYKIARLTSDGIAKSFVKPTDRVAQSRPTKLRHDSTCPYMRKGVGEVVKYPIGETIRCKGFGLYLYRKPSDNFNDYVGDRCVLKVRIEKGSMYRLGKRIGHKTVNARKITVLARVFLPE